MVSHHRRGFLTTLATFGFVFLFLFPEMGFAGNFYARTDRSNLSMGESVQLTLETADKSLKGEPNISVLEKDFTISGTAKSNQTLIINGQKTSKRQWILALIPKHKGTLTIPAVTLGNTKSKPITITVTKNSPKNKANQGVPVFMTVSVDNQTPYVQSELLYTVKLFYKPEAGLVGTVMTDPSTTDAAAGRLGNDIRYQSTQGKETYQVIERRYAIFPESAGKLTIKPPILTSQMQTGQGFGLLKPIRLTAEPIHVNVKPKPNAARNTWWLPAKSVTLTDDWNDKVPEFQVGEPVSRTLTLKAVGLMGTQLPSMPTSEVDGLSVYPEPAKKGTRLQGANTVGIAQQTIALIPTKAQPLTLPVLTIKWWNTQTHKLETATLPARTVQVKAAKGGVGVSGAQAGSSTQLTDASGKNLTDAQNPSGPLAFLMKLYGQTGPWLWPGIALICLMGWVSALFCIKRKNGPSHGPSDPEQSMDNNTPHSLRNPLQKLTYTNKKSSLAEFKSACLGNRPEQTNQALLAFAQFHWPEDHPLNLGDVANLCVSDEAREALTELAQALYSSPHGFDHHGWRGVNLWKAMKKEIKLSKKGWGRKKERSKAINSTGPQDLPGLYKS